MKYILLFLWLFCWGSVALAEERPYLLATVLFYNDGKGHQILATGHVQNVVKMAIKTSVRNRVGDPFAEVKVVPFLGQIDYTPAAVEIANLWMKDKYKDVYLTAVPRGAKDPYEKIVKEHLTKPKKSKRYAVKTSGNSEHKHYSKKAMMSRPHSVYYAVESICADPTKKTCYTMKPPMKM